jgi:hypothetical protein
MRNEKLQMGGMGRMHNQRGMLHSLHMPREQDIEKTEIGKNRIPEKAERMGKSKTLGI